MREIHAMNVYNSLHIMSTYLVLNTLHRLINLILLSTLLGEYYDCCHLIDEETEEKKLRHLPKVPQLTDELSLAPGVMLITATDCLLETQKLPGTCQVVKCYLFITAFSGHKDV